MSGTAVVDNMVAESYHVPQFVIGGDRDGSEFVDGVGTLSWFDDETSVLPPHNILL